MHLFHNATVPLTSPFFFYPPNDGHCIIPDCVIPDCIIPDSRVNRGDKSGVQRVGRAGVSVQMHASLYGLGGKGESVTNGAQNQAYLDREKGRGGGREGES